MTDRLQAPRGTYDVLPDEAGRRAAVETAAARVLGTAGYRRIETPAFEATELFARGVGGSTDIVQKEMFTFQDAGERSLTLRPEGTAPVCRGYLEHGMHKLPQPVRLWYMGSFFRHEAPQAGRYRQFWQVGAEAIGSDDPGLDAEAILLLAELLEALGVREVTLRLGSLGSPGTRGAYRERLQAHLREHEDELAPEVRERIALNPLRAFDAKDPGTRAVMAGAPRLLDALTGEDLEHFAQVRALLDGADVPYEIDPTLVRGLDYYTRTVFEFTSAALGAQDGVGAGGRYDGLIELLGGPPTAAMGWAAGVERMLLVAQEQPVGTVPVDLYVVSAKEHGDATAFRLAADARRAGLASQLELAGRSVKGAFKHADRLGARRVAIVGDEGVSVKDMTSGEQGEHPSGEAALAAVLRDR